MTKLLMLGAATMCAFAANSVLNRLAVSEAGMDAFAFALVRVTAAALILGLVLFLRRQSLGAVQNHWKGAFGLAVYLLGFSYGYTVLEAGIGALLLFGVVQLTMFVIAWITGERPKPIVWIGTGIAFAGLVYLLWPNEQVVPQQGGLLASIAMILAGVGWGVFSVAGKSARDVTQATTASFLICVPVCAIIWMLAGLPQITGPGLIWALCSGAVTSALGYILWYSLLPQIDISTAAMMQLSVPIIAIVGGIVFLGEALTVQVVISSVLVLGGIFGALLLNK